jgi:hypothetical protein
MGVEETGHVLVAATFGTGTEDSGQQEESSVKVVDNPVEIRTS